MDYMDEVQASDAHVRCVFVVIPLHVVTDVGPHSLIMDPALA